MRFTNLNNPKERIDDSLFFVRIMKELQYSKKEKYLLLCDPQANKQDFTSKLKQYAKKNNPYLNIALLEEGNNKYNEPSFFVKNILEDITSIKTFMQLKWYALSFIEVLILIVICMVVLLFLQFISTIFSVLTSGEIYNIKISNLLQIQSIISYIFSAFLGMLFPAMVAFIIMNVRKRLHKRINSNKQYEKYAEILREDNYKVALKIFKKKYLNDSGPLLVIIDSIDDYRNAFDHEFSSILCEYYDQFDGSVCFVFLSTNLTTTRLELLNKYQKFEFYKISPSAVNENILAPQINALSCIKYQEDKKNINQLFSKYTTSNWNPRTIFQFLSVGQYFSLYGFKPERVGEILELSKDNIRKYLKLAKYDNSLINTRFNVLFYTYINADFQKYTIANPFYCAYSINPFIKKISYEDISTENRYMYNIIYFFAYSQLLLRERNDLVLFDLINIIDSIFYDLKNNSLLIGKDLINKTTFKLLKHYQKSNLSILCKKVAILYIITKEQSINSLINEEDLIALESFILYHESTSDDIALLLDIAKTNTIENCLLSYLYLINSKDENILKQLSVDLDATSKTTKVFYRWLISDKESQYFKLPLIVDKIINYQDSVVKLSENTPQFASGFNFSTLQSLLLLFETNCMNDDEKFTAILKVLLIGILRLKNDFSDDYNKIDKTWSKIVSVIVLVEYLEFTYKLNNNKRLWINERKSELINLMGDESIIEDLNKLLVFLQIKCVLVNKKIIQISLFNSLENELNSLMLDTVLKELKGLEQLLKFYHIRLMIITKSIYNLDNKGKFELFNDIVHLESKPSLARQSFYVEHLIVKYLTFSDIHRSLSYESLEKLIIELEKRGSNEELLNSVEQGFIELLRFSGNNENRKKAINLKLKQRRKIIKGKLIYSPLKLVQFYALLADDLFLINKLCFAKICLKKSIEYFENYINEVDEDYRYTEMLLFSIQNKIELINKSKKEQKIIYYLSSSEYFNTRGSGILYIINVYLYSADLINFDIILNAIANRENEYDWHAGYIWSHIFCNLIFKIKSKPNLISNIKVEDLIWTILLRLKQSNQSQIDVDGLMISIPTLLRIISLEENHEKSNRLIDYLSEIKDQKISMEFANTIRYYLLEGEYSKIIDTYYKVFYDELFNFLEDIIKKYLLEPIENMTEYEYGLKLYEKNNDSKEKLWIRIFILKHLTYYAVYNNNKEQIEQLTNEYKYFGYEYIESMINKLTFAPFVSKRTKEILCSHLNYYKCMIE
ncbi:MAG: hypothetical protein V1773_06940 [bacterium]